MKKTVNAVTYSQAIEALQFLVNSGRRSGDQPLMITGKVIESITDMKTGETIVEGTVRVEIDVPPLLL